MAVRTREEILDTISKLDGDAVDSIMEDIADSWGSQTAQANFESEDNPYKAKFAELQSKYRQRFVGGSNGDIASPTTREDINGESSIKEDIYREDEKKVSFDSLFKKLDFSPSYRG